jgi:RNA polymerase sigma-70 factor (ECF subfamily)
VDIDEFTDIGETQENLDDRITLWETVNRLDDEYRMVIILFYYEGMKIKDIAKTLEISEANVKKRLQRARGHLSQMLDREDFQ